MKDEVVKAVRKARIAHKKTPLGALEELLRQESRWKRKFTIASNKLAEVRMEINCFAMALVTLEVKNESDARKAT